MATLTMPALQTLPAVNEPNSELESDLVTRAKRGDDAAFAILFDRHKRRVYSLCLRMTGSIPEAEDLTQDAFIQVFRKLETFRGDAAFSTWLYRVAMNTVLMKLRKRNPRQVSLDEPVRLESAVVQRNVGYGDPNLLGAVDRVTLARAIQKLPGGCRTIFLLHEVKGYEHNEIAKMLHCSVGNSKSQLHKARLKIREILLAGPGEAAHSSERASKARKAGGHTVSRAEDSPAIGESEAEELHSYVEELCETAAC